MPVGSVPIPKQQHVENFVITAEQLLPRQAVRTCKVQAVYGPLHRGTKDSCRSPLPQLSQAGRRARPAPHDNASSLCDTQGVRWAAQHVFQVRNTQFHSFVIVVRKAQICQCACAMRNAAIADTSATHYHSKEKIK